MPDPSWAHIAVWRALRSEFPPTVFDLGRSLHLHRRVLRQLIEELPLYGLDIPSAASRKYRRHVARRIHRAEKRRKTLLTILREPNYPTLDELADLFTTSRNNIVRDIRLLKRQGLLPAKRRANGHPIQ